MWRVHDKAKNKFIDLKTKDMINDFKKTRKDSRGEWIEYKYAIPISKPLTEESPVELPIDPYLLGVLLGDGGMTQKTITITTADEELVEKIKQRLSPNYILKKLSSDKYSYSIKRLNPLVEPFYKRLDKLGLWKHKSLDKFIPEIYKKASNEQKLELIKGLMDTDGYNNGQTTIEYYSSCKQLADDFTEISRSIGLHCRQVAKMASIKGKSYGACYRVTIYTKQPIFSLYRKLTYVDFPIHQQGRFKYDKCQIVNIEYIGKKDGYCIAVDNEDKTYITKDYIVTHNTYLLAIYCVLRCVLVPGTKIVVCGAGFRQAKLVYEYIETIWANAPVLRSICGGTSGSRKDTDRWHFILGESTVIAIPLGTGEKIRGIRAHIIIADEFGSIRPDIYETVVSGFASVSSDVVGNVKTEAKKLYLKEYNEWNDDLERIYEGGKRSNQSIISGTATYDFEHFADYWKKYKAIIKSKGDMSKIKEAHAGKSDEDVGKINWRDYSIIRIPFDLIPKGFMDDKHIARAKATVHSGTFGCEYGAVFSKDSEGFFKRTLIESCVAKEKNLKEANLPYCKSPFDAVVYGDPKKHYIYGIDPASENDNFSIVILEAYPEHARVVYCWTTNKYKMRKFGDSDDNYYAYCARKIRNLMKTFPCVRMGVDTQGGGYALMEALHDKNAMEEGERQLWPIIDPEDEKDTDFKDGLHIIEEISFASSKWTTDANHGLRKDMESKALLFPRYDGLMLSLAADNDMQRGVDKHPEYDSLEICIEEIEELKNELSMIVMEQTGVIGRDRWDTPEVKTQTGRKEKLRKDRYSALLIANMLARTANRTEIVSFGYTGGGLSTQIAKKTNNDNMYNSTWYKFCPRVINRG